jgi:hypothetical protein
VSLDSFRRIICTNLFSLDLRGNHAVNSDIRIDLSSMSESFYSILHALLTWQRVI